jgi:hypothetical protein
VRLVTEEIVPEVHRIHTHMPRSEADKRAQDKYRQSPKGKAAQKRYRQSEKGLASNRRAVAKYEAKLKALKQQEGQKTK